MSKSASEPRTLAARAMLSRAPVGRSTMRSVAVAELSKLIVRIEEEAAAPYRAELEWALEQITSGASPDPLHLARIRELLDRR